MHKLEIKLKQHTPLIHFQHDQKGATLRASEVKPKLDKFVLTKLGNGNYEAGVDIAKVNGWLIGKGDHPALDYKMRIIDNPDNILTLETNKKREYKKKNEDKDKKSGWKIRIVEHGEIINKPEGKIRLVIEDEDGKRYYAKWRQTDSKVIYDLDPYPCFFANMGCDILDSNEYRKVTFAEGPFQMSILTKHLALYELFNDRSKKILSLFFLNTNFGTRQSKGFGSFYIDENEQLYVEPHSTYSFNVPIVEDSYYDEFYSLFEKIELFTKTLRAGINDKRQDGFYFKSLAFMYCKDILNAEWDKKRVKASFYFNNSPRRNDSLQKQIDRYHDYENRDILYFDSIDGYDIRDLLGFSTNEEWLSYKDSIEKKVALINDEGRPIFPRREDTLPVDRMRSPLLVKPICRIDEDDNVSYDIFLLFQDNEVGMKEVKRQKKICFYSKREKDERGFAKRIMLDLPQSFSMSDYFDYIFNQLQIDVSEHVEEKYHQHDYFEKLKDIYEQLKDNISQ